MSNFYFKTRKRMIAWICAITMVVAGLTVVPKTVVAGDTETDYSTLTWTQVGKTEYWVAPLEAFPMDAVELVNDEIKILPKVNAGDYKIWPAFSEPTLNDSTVGVRVDGAGIYIKKSSLNDGYNVFKATSSVEVKEFHIIISKGNPGGSGTETPGETTTPDATKPIMGSGVEIKILGNETLYIAGLKTIKNATTYELYQDGKLLREVNDGDNIHLSELTPGEHEYYVIGVNKYGKSEPSKIYKIVIPEVKASKNIIVDNGAPETVEEDSEYKFGDAKYGYYDINKNVIYKAGSTIKVKDNMHLVSIKDIKLSFTNGAAIRIDAGDTVTTPGGIRFQAKLDVTCGDDGYKNTIINALQAGTMITTKDILENSRQEYTVENIEKIGTVLNVVNKGWKNVETHTFNASLINIVEADYTRYFVAKAYVKVPYANDVPAEYVYSENDAGSAEQVERSISDIAKTISGNGYDGIDDENIKSLINSFIRK